MAFLGRTSQTLAYSRSGEWPYDEGK
jgi:hypothetical protein